MFTIEEITPYEAMQEAKKGKDVLVTRNPSYTDTEYHDSYRQSFGTLSWEGNEFYIQINAWKFKPNNSISNFCFYIKEDL